MARNGRNRRQDDTTIRDELEALGAQISRLGEKTLSEGQDRVAEEIERVRSALDSMITRVGDRGETALDAVVTTVQQRPLASMAGAFAAGIVLSSLMNRR